MSEEQLLSDLSKGSQEALRGLFDQYYTDLTRYALKIIAHPESAEELVQDVFVSVWNNRENSTIENAKAYLFRAVKNRCINHINSKYPVHDDLEHSMHIASTDIPTDEIESMELAAVLKMAEKQLPKQTALVFSLSRHTEMTYPEIAKELDISVKTVEYHISKALKFFKDFLREHGVFIVCFFLGK